MNLYLLCAKIFFARIIDVSLSTFVTILTVKGKRKYAAILGFIDVLIWFLVVKEALNTKTQNIIIAFSYAGGYAFGTFIGTTLCNNIIKEKILIQVIIDNKLKSKINILRNEGYAVSIINCSGKDNSNKLLLYIEIDKKQINTVKKLIKQIDPNAFFLINETKYVENGFFK